MHKRLIYIIILILSLPIHAQINNTDTILISIMQLPDSAKLNILMEKALQERLHSLNKALLYADRRMVIAQKLNDAKAIAQNWHIYGNIFTSAGLYDNAEESYKKSLSAYDSLDMREEKASILHNLGLIYHRKMDTLKTIEYYTRSVNYRKEVSNSQRIGDELTTLGESYLSFKEYDKSIKALNEALTYYRGIKIYKRKADAFALLFDNYIAAGKKGSLQWIDSLKSQNSIIGLNSYRNMINLRLCKYHLKNNDLEFCSMILDSIDFIMLHNIEVIDPLDIYLEVSQKYKEAGNESKAIEYSILYRKQKDENIRNEVRQLVSNYKIRFSILSSEEEIAMNREQNKLILKRLKTEKTISFIIYMTLGITLIILIYTFYNIRGIRKTNRKLENRRMSLREAYERKTKYKENILRTRENKNIFFSIVSLKLSKPFNDLSLQLNEISRYLSENNKDLKLKKMMQTLFDEASMVEKNLGRVLLWSKLQRNKYGINTERINLSDFLHEMLPSLLGTALKKNIRIRFDLKPVLNISYDKYSLKTIIEILTENSIEHSSHGKDIIIRAQKVKNGCVLSVTDFGAGIPGELKKRIFDINSVGKNNTRSNKMGLGLLIARMIAERNNSVISIESKERSGTTIFIHIKEEKND